MTSDSSFISQIVKFIEELFRSLGDKTLFFGGPWDFIRNIIDIILVTFLFYTLFMFIRQTRAWQLIKGIVLILLFVAFCGLIGLDMVGFLFNRLLYIFAILFAVLFQPELRRALETVGLRTSNATNPFKHSESAMTEEEMTSFIKEISSACKEMSRTYTGALILIERNTKLNELLSQENVVAFDSEVTSSVLQSIFYKGSPMHDGGLLIRDGRIIAARCHVPLSVTMHSLERSGTRHRAAVGASEMGDTVAVVVSEERGKTSIAVNGRLYEMRTDRELEANLSYLLGLKAFGGEKKGVFARVAGGCRNLGAKVKSFFVKEKPGKNSKKKAKVPVEIIPSKSQVEVAGESIVPITIRTKTAVETSNSQRVEGSTRVVFLVLSLFLSLVLWVYIQTNTNPVVTRTMTVPVTYLDDELAERNIQASYPIQTVDLVIVGRESTISKLTQNDIVATIDYNSGIVEDESALVTLEVQVSAKKNVYFRVESQLPEEVSVMVF